MVQELRKAKASYYTQLISNARGNKNSLWKYLNHLTNKTIKHKGIRELTIDGNNMNNSTTMAHRFNSYFIQSVEDLAKDFTPTALFNYPTQTASGDKFHIKQVHEANVAQIISKINKVKNK